MALRGVELIGLDRRTKWKQITQQSKRSKLQK
nr:MAG TPA: hypothetical protein [Caudoviricetes sp.]